MDKSSAKAAKHNPLSLPSTLGSPLDERAAISNAIRIGNLRLSDFGFMVYNGVLPLQLPDGVRMAILPDIHAPAHHEQIMWAVKEFLADYQPHLLMLIGDVGDVFGLSAWPKNPRTPDNLAWEVGEIRELIDELREVSGALHTFITMGNHEDRNRRWLMNVGSKISGLVGLGSREPIMSFHELLGYTPRDPVTFIYDQQNAGGFGGGLKLNGDLKLIHGYIVRPRPGASPRAVSDKDLQSVVHGHTHRLGANMREITRGIVRSYEIGMLVNPSHSMMGYANLLNNWHPGFAVGTVVNGNVHVNMVPIIQVDINGRPRHMFQWNGKFYKSADR
jgi:hypothetical protein